MSPLLPCGGRYFGEPRAKSSPRAKVFNKSKVFNAENAEGRGGTQREAKGGRAGGAWTLNVAIVASL
jgi:hypothetical protein